MAEEAVPPTYLELGVIDNSGASKGGNWAIGSDNIALGVIK